MDPNQNQPNNQVNNSVPFEQPANLAQGAPQPNDVPIASVQQSPQVFQPQIITPNQDNSVPAPVQPESSATPPSQPLPTQSPNDLANQPPPSSSPQDGSGTVYGSFQPSIAPNPADNPRPSRKKRLLISGGIAAGIVLLVSAAVFGLYVPNQPDNVFRSGVKRTGTALDKMIVAGTEEEKLKEFANTELTGSLEVDAAGEKFSGTFSSKYDDKQSDSSLTYKSDSAEGGNQNLAFQLLTNMADGKDYPDIYFKISGFASLGLGDMPPEIAQYDGKWISATSDYIKSLVPAGEKPEDAKIDFTQKDAAELARAISGTTREYLFSADPEKAVMVQKEFVGTEKLDSGITANHYKVGINKDNSKKYCRALIDSVTATEAYKKLPGVSGEDVGKQREDAKKGCDQSINDDFKDSDTFDMWVDKRRKLVHKIRFSEKDDPSSYVEIGQNFTKGSTVPLFVIFHSDKDKYDAKMTLEVDIEKSITKGSFTMNGGDNDDKYSAKANFEFKPHDGDVKVEPPGDAIPLDEVLKALGVDPAAYSAGGVGSGITAKAEDTERETDIRALHAQLEAYYAVNGFYPSLNQLNDRNWRQQNLRGLDEEAIKAPNSDKAEFSAAATVSQYGYAPTGCVSGGSECSGYELTAIYSDGTKYSKLNLN